MHHANQLRVGDTVSYQAATPAAINAQAPAQPAEQGPYTSGIVDFPGDDRIGVRADGWWGQAPLYSLHVSDILSVQRRPSS